MSSGRTTDNTADCPAKWGHGNRNFTDYRIQQDVNDYSRYNVTNNNEYRLLLQRNGNEFINQQRQNAYVNNQCNTCDIPKNNPQE
jgi:hypothetical protein